MRHLISSLAFAILPAAGIQTFHRPTAVQTSVDVLQIKNKAIVRGYMDRIVNQGRWEDWERYFSEGLTFNGSPVTKQQIKNMVEQMRRSLPGFRLTIENQIAQGDTVVTVVTRVTFHGTAANGQEIQYMGIGIDRLSGGSIVEMWHLADEPMGNEKR